MKVYLEPGPGLGRAIHRVANALKRHAPAWVEVMDQPEQADLRIWQVLGAGERNQLLTTTQPSAIFQLCLRTSEHPNTKDWVDIWKRAAVVTSYYDLNQLILEDAADEGCYIHSIDEQEDYILPNFLHAPLGLDPAFTAIGGYGQRPFLIGTSGTIASTEGVTEWAEVCRRLKAHHYHLGPQLSPEMLYCGQPITDAQVANYWRACRYVAAMRRVEGFEFPGIEGLACGARPVCFDRVHYKCWYGEHADYVPEGTPEEVVDALLALVAQPYRAVTAAEQQWARETFNWETILSEFWARLEGAVR